MRTAPIFRKFKHNIFNVVRNQSFPATDKSIGKELTHKFKAAGGGVEWKRADLLKSRDDDEPFHLFNKVCMSMFVSDTS